MASAKETPRQKMIGMMYLVLTALLALNVSKDILDAFVVVNKGLEKTNFNFTERNENLYAQFDLAKQVDPVRVLPNWAKAQEVKKHSEELSNFIDELQKQLVQQTEGVERNVSDTLKMENIKSKDNYDIPTNIMIGDSEDGSKGEAGKLRMLLEAYKNRLTDFILPEDRNNVKVDINTANPEHSENNENWELYNFYHRPLVASLTILSKIKNDVKNAESVVVDYLLKQTDGEALKFDTIAAKVIPQSNYVILGDDYKADLFVAAFSRTKNPDVQVGSYDFAKKEFLSSPQQVYVENGLGKYTVKTTKEGVVNYSGIIKMKSGKNKELVFPFSSEYIVAKPSIAVSADNMNVVYYNLENPITVSVPGFSSERTSISVSNAAVVSKGNGKYVLKPQVNNGKAEVTVFATTESGEKRNMGTMTFRIKKVPTPFAKFGELTESGSMEKNKVQVQTGLIAYYKDFEYLSNVNPKVISFKMFVIGAGKIVEEFESTNNLFTKEMGGRLQRVKKGEMVFFEDIYAVGPDGLKVKLPSMSVKVN